jgi:hypothetical protein
MMFFGFNHHVDRLVEAGILEKHAVSIFRAEVISARCLLLRSNQHGN